MWRACCSISSRSSRPTTTTATTDAGFSRQRGSGPARPHWDVAAYSAFAGERLRPALDLIACIPDKSPRFVFDLGCGTGAATRLLLERWPGAAVSGIDASAEMLDEARTRPEQIRWLQADLGAWTPDAQPDLLFSNAALHWLDDHQALFRRLFDLLAPGGVLAVQMPSNFAAPTHRAIADLAGRGRWRGRLLPLVRQAPVAPAEAYLALLLPLASSLDVWETTYWHVLEGEDPVPTWSAGAALRPILAVLDEAERREFMAAYSETMRAAYPRRGDGLTLLPFRRLFIVAAR